VTGPEPSDRELVALVAERGDETAFRTLYRRHTPRLYRTALRLAAGDVAEAEEITQEAWIRAVGRFPAFEWRARLSTWLVSITVNCARERWRAAGTVERLDAELPVADRELEDTPARIDVERALAQLPPRYREVVVLHELEGYTHEEIAELLGIEPGTSKSQLHHARRRLRTLIQEDGR
jgi:RNA polymerase sigma-70 factor (ECF subfamily)